MPLSGLPKSSITIVSPDGQERAKTNATVTKDLAVISDPKITVLPGDEIRRMLPNGREEAFDVIDPMFYEAMPGLGAHYQVKISRKGEFAPKVGGNYSINVSGPNARVNIGSYDASHNTVHIGNRLDELRDVLAQSISDQAERDKLVSMVEKMEAEKGSAGYLATYQKFIASTADHMTLVAPFLPLLATFLPS